ncbi:DUF1059 domain-containing protein [Mesorhizobium sp. M0488]|uniref:DUF1059 domain-containing protein n=1 Tax=Mesorhizobium sp. M0488 TaxID=2956949 RepID=UPI0033387C0A
MKEFHCGSLVPGCDWHTRAEEEAEVMRRAVEHMRETHGETTIRETMIEAIRSRIEKAREGSFSLPRRAVLDRKMYSSQLK